MKEVSARIRCSGTFHTIGIRDGRAFCSHHDRDEVVALRASEKLSGIEVDIPCLRMMEEIDTCLRSHLPPTDGMPRAIFDFIIRQRARAVADLRHRQRHLERKVRRVMRQAELAAKDEIGGLEDVLEEVEQEIYGRFQGEGTSVLMEVFSAAENRIWARRRDLDLRGTWDA